MKVAPEARKLVIISLLSLIISLYAAKGFTPLYMVSFISAVVLLFSLYFFRDPKRNPNFKANEISSPGDGTVISISDEGSQMMVIRIFLSIFDTHIQRSPVKGRIKEIKFYPGRFSIAYKHKAKDNQRNMIKIVAQNGKEVWVEQIAGAIARRINCYVRQGQEINNGEKIGIIYFGSQVALYLPKDVKIKVKPKQKLKAAVDVVAEW
ncbi:MAG: phosphatidylserine decarboxylase [Elusimicrobiales bacterium]